MPSSSNRIIPKVLCCYSGQQMDSACATMIAEAHEDISATVGHTFYIYRVIDRLFFRNSYDCGLWIIY
jgi:hypothetical protein